MKRLSTQQKNRYASGFSLIEVLVSLSIFAVVVTISVGSLMVLVDVNARARGTHAAMTNLSFALDSMTREMRTGSDYYCPVNTGTGVNGLNHNNAVAPNSTRVRDCSRQSFFVFNEGGKSLTENTPNNSRRIAYRLNNGAIERRLGNGDGNGSLGQATDWLAITDANLDITRLDFYVTGSTPMSAPGSDVQTPLVTMYIQGRMRNDPTRVFDIQTSVSQHLLDI
jgi:prepilin-type N-terminal cleavage/methylation domain-containing protein